MLRLDRRRSLPASTSRLSICTDSQPLLACYCSACDVVRNFLSKLIDPGDARLSPFRGKPLLRCNLCDCVVVDHNNSADEYDKVHLEANPSSSSQQVLLRLEPIYITSAATSGITTSK